ncbi:Fe(3+)-hydroxamate ABC transporter permease FhuB [Agrobacterium rosae]|uniref:Fe(3+)-hydroxamate ABC transporter permease FhuB n=1 Tax=Agrobacterium rosae TaxID=1972867 RepID=UPI000CD7E4E0|nr:Fe(3+)-hydroxamate ABC transporter permease FhuB [Agrobacterium rosae]POO55687.1 Fe(3+)-hydroxamate ABC transporter permease FhuB [Agrobacterium rosae]
MPGMASTASQSATTNRAVISVVAVASACITMLALLIWTRPLVPGDPTTAAVLGNILLWNSLLPRAVIALFAGAALGLAGALLQQVLRNPIADASTLGIAAGAELALVAGLSLSPLLAGFSREIVAFAGGLAAVALVLALSWRQSFDPVTVAVSGLIVSMITASLTITLILARGEYALSVSIWGAGSLSQQDWQGVVSLAPRLVFGAVLALVLIRPLNLLALDDASAKSLGLSLLWLRLAILLLAVWLAASVTANVGVIGFLGLAAPALAKLCGARTRGQVLIAAPLAGAALLFITDGTSQLLGAGFSDLVPAGAATALMGGPVLLFLLPRLHAIAPVTAATAPIERRLARPISCNIFIAAIIVALGLAALIIGPSPTGLRFTFGQDLWELLPFRLPRILAAGGAGALLGAAGFIMQRVTGNPIASPEVLGVSAGGGAGLAATLYIVGSPSPTIMLVGMSLGALTVFSIMIAITAARELSAERLLLTGIAMSAISMAIVTIVLAQGDMRSFILLMWMAGSTNRAGNFEAFAALIALALFAAPLLFMSRWLTILPLGTVLSKSIGLGLTSSRLALAILAALMTAVASFLVGPLSLAGLVAPHLARLIGLNDARQQMLASLMIGAALLIGADWLSRVVIYPYQVPVGVFTALIGGPYLLWLIVRIEKRS